jgi:magnesium chelatase family protein
MLARVTTFAIDGVQPRRVLAEVDIRPGLPAFTIVGLGDAAVRESRERIRVAIANCGLEFPQRRITANLAPASLRKAGPGFDAALALALLAASGQLAPAALDGTAVFGELSLGGELRDSPGVLVVAEGARRHRMARLIVPRGRAAEAALVDGLDVVGVRSLREALAVLRGDAQPEPIPRADVYDAVCGGPDLADVRGQRAAIAALEIAAAGGHNLLLEGPPGTGKTMLASRLPSILPPMSQAEALEVTRIHSVAGLGGGGLIRQRPFRAPHHTISAAGLVGGGSSPRPGEASLAHRGVLFLDELSEFQRSTLDALRQPLEDGQVSIVRGQHVLVFPTRVMLVAATNPCPCGYAGDGDRCTCSEADLRRHRRRLSGPLLDRIDLLVNVGRPSERELRETPQSDSASVRARVRLARERQHRRLGEDDADRNCNAQLDAATLRRSVRLSEGAEATLDDAYRSGVLSVRGRSRVVRVAQTIADLDGHREITREDLLLALSFRVRSGNGSPVGVDGCL